MLDPELRAMMAGFPFQVIATTDIEDKPCIAFVHQDMVICDVGLSSCGRFEAGPELYDLSLPQWQAFKALGVSLVGASAEAIAEVALELNRNKHPQLDDDSGPRPQT